MLVRCVVVPLRGGCWLHPVRNGNPGAAIRRVSRFSVGSYWHACRCAAPRVLVPVQGAGVVGRCENVRLEFVLGLVGDVEALVVIVSVWRVLRVSVD